MSHKKELSPKYNPHIKKNRRGHHEFSIFLLSMVGCLIVIVAVVAGFLMVRSQAESQARRNVAERVQQNNQPQEPVYDQNSLKHKSDHSIDQQMVNRYSKVDSGFAKRISYSSKTDVAKVELTKPAARALNYASKSKPRSSKQLNQSIQTGIKIDDQLSNQAVEITNQAHDGYFTFAFANAPQYQAPNTKTGSFKE